MTWWLIDGACAGFCAWLITREILWERKRRRIEATNTLPPAEERPDYRALVVQDRVCPVCFASFQRNPVVVDLKCDECIGKAFESHVLEQREWMVKQGWEEKG